MGTSIDFNEIFNQVKEQLTLSDDGTNPYIPDIMEFCNSKKYLNLPGNGITLYPMQNIFLKVFYRGQRGNEHLRLTEEEINLLKENEMQSILDKYQSGNIFRELVLVLGRRSGKNFSAAIISLYETMKLLECPGGNPFLYYKIATGNPIYIMTIATAAEQAKLLFGEIRERAGKSEYFKNKISKVDSETIYLLTLDDKKNNKLYEETGQGIKTDGSVVVMSGHSNSYSLLGKRVACLLLDEVASYKNTGGPSSGEEIYKALTPCTADFKTQNRKPDDKHIPVYDSKIISISSPRAEEGILYKLYSEAPQSKFTVAFRLPTWKVNLSLTEESLREEFNKMTISEFNMEFGAEFSGTSGERFIPEQYIYKSQEIGKELNLKQRLQGSPGVGYYAHLDPASSSHNYALTVVHAEERLRVRASEKGVPQKEKYKLFVVDHIKMWQPPSNGYINIDEVDEYIINLARRFRFVMISYDNMLPVQSIKKLRSKGIPCKLTHFRKSYKMTVYDHLEKLMVNNQLALPSKTDDAELLASELKFLKRIYSGGTGFSIKPDKEAPIKTDDLADSLAGACQIAIDEAYGGYAKSGTVYLPQSQSNGQQWNVGSGSYNSTQWEFMKLKNFGKV